MEKDFELMLFDRLEAIKTTIKKYGEDNFYLSYSGGRDSTILSFILDLALPENNIPRVYADTGMDLALVNKFVKDNAEKDHRIVILKPTMPIKATLEKYGYPSKSKSHSSVVRTFQSIGFRSPWVTRYLGGFANNKEGLKIGGCPKALRHQFTPEYNIKISDKCCLYMKEKPLNKWAKENNKEIGITAILKEEGGRRTHSACLTSHNGKVRRFNPFFVVNNEFLDWLCSKYNIKLAEVYYPPYNMKRTGCKGCPFSLNLQKELDMLEKFFPNERKQCEIIWKPIYDDYRQHKYRLKELTNERD